MKRFLLTAAVLAATLVSCQRERLDTPVQSAYQEDGSLSFSTYSQKTKGEIAYIEQLQAQGFSVLGFENVSKASGDPTLWHTDLKANFFGPEGVKGTDTNYFQFVSHSSGSWQYSPIQYWPDDDLATLDFIAVSPGDTNEVSGGYAPKWKYYPASNSEGESKLGDFEVNSDIASQTDLLLATKFNAVQVAKVMLEFKHALSRIGFSAYTPGEKDIIVKKIQLQHASTTDPSSPVAFFQRKGSLSFKEKSSLSSSEYTTSWDSPLHSDTDSLSFVLTAENDFINGGLIASTPTQLNNDDKFLMVIPTNNASYLEIYIEYTVTGEGGETSVKTKKFTCPVASFDMGYAYTFNFNLSLNEVLFDCKVIPWDERAISLTSGGDVQATSDKEGYEVYVDATRYASGSTITTSYTLYAVMKEDSEDPDNAMYIPRWKIYNKWSQEETGYDVPIGELIDVYLAYYKYVLEVGDVTMSEVEIDSKRYTTLSFKINENNPESKSAFKGTYVAHYVKDPVQARVFLGGAQVDTAVRVDRVYEYWTDLIDGKLPEPYLTGVTLTVKGTMPLPFKKWQKLNESTGEYEDIDYSSTSEEYKLGKNNELIFLEKQMMVDGDDSTVVSHQGTYAARFGDESTGDISIGLADNYGGEMTITPAQLMFNEDDKIVVSARTATGGETFEWDVNLPGVTTGLTKIDGSESESGKYTWQSEDGVLYTEFSWETKESRRYLTFNAHKTINGIKISSQYGTTSVTVKPVTTAGYELTYSKDYTREDNAGDLTSYFSFFKKNITDLNMIEVQKDDGEWYNVKDLVVEKESNLFYKYSDDGTSIAFVVNRTKEAMTAALGANATAVNLRVNNSTTFEIKLANSNSYPTDMVLVCEQGDGSKTELSGQGSCYINPELGDAKIYKKDTETRAFYGFAYKRTYQGQVRTFFLADTLSIDYDLMPVGHSATFNPLMGVQFTYTNNTSNTYKIPVFGKDAKELVSGNSYIIPSYTSAGITPEDVDNRELFCIKRPDTSSVEEVKASVNGGTPEILQPYVGDETRYLLDNLGFNATQGSTNSTVVIDPKNGTQKLIEGGDLF